MILHALLAATMTNILLVYKDAWHLQVLSISIWFMHMRGISNIVQLFWPLSFHFCIVAGSYRLVRAKCADHTNHKFHTIQIQEKLINQVQKYNSLDCMVALYDKITNGQKRSIFPPPPNSPSFSGLILLKSFAVKTCHTES